MTRWTTVGRTRVVIAGCLGGLLVGRCTGGGSDGGADDRADGKERESPLEEYLGYSPLAEVVGGGAGMFVGVRIAGPAEMSGADENKMRQVEELVAECMREQGFEYVPRAPGEEHEGPHDDAFSLEPEEFAKRYGYGLSTIELMPDPEATESDDPNERMRNELSPEAREAYEEALYGEMVEPTASGENGEVDVVEIGPGEGGCYSEADKQVYGDREELEPPGENELVGLHEDVFALQKRFNDDPRVVAAYEKWSTCMADGGHPDFGTPQDAFTEVMNRLDELRPAPTGTDSSDETVTPTRTPDPADVDQEALAELNEYEIEVAVADFECQREHVKTVADKVADELERKFIEEHRAELERYRDTAGEFDR